MTELRHFLTSLYDAASEAEMQALLNGRQRLRRMVESGEFADDVSLPVYHATDLSVSLDVGLEARETKRGIQVFVTEPSADDQTELGFDLEVYDFLKAEDLTSRSDDPKRPGGGLDVHIPLREPPIDSGDSSSSPGEKNDHTRGQARARREQADDDRRDDERADDERAETESTNDESRKKTPNGDEKSADDRERAERDRNKARSERRTTAYKHEQPRFPGLNFPGDWARGRGSRDAEDDDR